MTSVVIVIGFIFFPLFILYICNRYKFLNKIVAVVLAYVFGIIIGNVGIFTEDHRKVIEYISMGSIPVALPLILFSSDLKRWVKMAPGALISMIIGLASILFTVFIGFKLFHDKIPETWKISGMFSCRPQRAHIALAGFEPSWLSVCAWPQSGTAPPKR